MTVGPGPDGFAVRALEAPRGELRSRTRLSSRPHAPPRSWRRGSGAAKPPSRPKAPDRRPTT